MSRKIAEEIEKGAEILKKGGLVAYPTDTVYGLGACSTIDSAVKRIFEVKNRPIDTPLPLLLGDVSWINAYAYDISPVARALAEVFLPGALTLVVKKAASVSDIISGGKDTIALRVPGHPITLELIASVNQPIIGTSANLSGHPSAITAQEVDEQIGDSIDYVIDGGETPGGKESTIIDVTGDVPVILRHGAISIEEINKVCIVKIPDKE